MIKFIFIAAFVVLANSISFADTRTIKCSRISDSEDQLKSIRILTDVTIQISSYSDKVENEYDTVYPIKIQKFELVRKFSKMSSESSEPPDAIVIINESGGEGEISVQRMGYGRSIKFKMNDGATIDFSKTRSSSNFKYEDAGGSKIDREYRCSFLPE